MLPESHTTVAALASRELVVVVDSFLTDSARLAHLVLPTTTLLEADDLLGAYGHHYLGVATPVVPPPEGVRSDLAIIQELARRVGLDEALAGSARSWKERLMKPKLAPEGLALADLERGAVRNPLAPRIVFADRRFATPSGRVNLVHELPPSEPPPSPSDEYPLLLMALSTERAQCSQWSRPPESPPVVTVHPDGAGGLADGAIARLRSAIGEIEVRVRHDPSQRRDVALMAKGGHLARAACANVLVRARTTDHGEGGALYDERVRLVPLVANEAVSSGWPARP